MTYLVVIDNENGNWGAYAPNLPGLGVAGSSKEEVQVLIREAIEFHVEGLRESGQPVPEPTASVEYVKVA